MGEQMHDDDVAVSYELARVLISEQFPDYAGLALEPLSCAGTVNVIFRLGDDLGARFPRRAGDTNATPTGLRRAALDDNPRPTSPRTSSSATSSPSPSASSAPPLSPRPRRRTTGPCS